MTGESIPQKNACVICERESPDMLFVRGKGVCGRCFTELYKQSVARVGRLSEERYKNKNRDER